MPTMNVSLTEQLAEMVARKVESGLYGNASEVVREALRLMVDREEARNTELTAIRQKIERGLAQAERGEFAGSSVSDVITEAKARKKKTGQKRRSGAAQ